MSLETTNSLLDLLCYYGDQEPSVDFRFQQREQSEELVITVSTFVLELIAFQNRISTCTTCQGSNKRFVLRGNVVQ